MAFSLKGIHTNIVIRKVTLYPIIALFSRSCLVEFESIMRLKRLLDNEQMQKLIL
jgi:hypothetical protein